MDQKWEDLTWKFAEIMEENYLPETCLLKEMSFNLSKNLKIL